MKKRKSEEGLVNATEREKKKKKVSVSDRTKSVVCSLGTDLLLCSVVSVSIGQVSPHHTHSHTGLTLV